MCTNDEINVLNAQLNEQSTSQICHSDRFAYSKQNSPNKLPKERKLHASMLTAHNNFTGELKQNRG